MVVNLPNVNLFLSKELNDKIGRLQKQRNETSKIEVILSILTKYVDKETKTIESKILKGKIK